jgi:uncharacterized cupin superfamily protein
MFNVKELSHRELSSKKTGEKYSLSASLSERFGFQDLFIHHEVIPPGRRASAPHRHTHREEMIVVLEGAPTAHVGNEARILKPGDLVGFKPEDERLHFVENKTSAEVRVLVVASNPQQDQTIF